MNKQGKICDIGLFKYEKLQDQRYWSHDNIEAKVQEKKRER